MGWKGPELAATHLVQSHRGMVERAFAKLKKWGGLSGGLVDSIDTKEKELDCAMALQNLIERFRMNLQAGIPARAPFSADAHIITPDLEPSMKIPKTVAMDSVNMPAHVVRFHTALSSIVPKLSMVLLNVKGEGIFTARVEHRGMNLFSGGNVLQFMVAEEEFETWRVRVSVGASMKAPIYLCYVRLNANVGELEQICECKNG